MSWTATTPLTAAIAADRFGAKHIGVIFGTLYTFMNLGSGLGSFIDGIIYERSHAYALALIGNIVFGVVGAVGAFRIGEGPLPELRGASPAPRDREPVPALGAPAD
jgi:MFS family permease